MRCFLKNMEKKTIFLELPAEIIDRIDRENIMGDRSTFITHLLQKQLQDNLTTMNASTDLLNKMEELNSPIGLTNEINLVTSMGQNLGSFDINSVRGFEELTKKISEISEDPKVRLRAELLK